MNHGYSEVFDSVSGLRAASDNIRMIDAMLKGMPNESIAAMSMAEQIQTQLGLVQQLADMVVARHAYRSNNRVLASTDALLDKLYQ